MSGSTSITSLTSMPVSGVITIAAPPSTTAVATNIMAYQTGQSGVVTDYNIGSQIRTLSESIGSVEEIQGVSAQATAFQALVYSAYSAFGIYPIAAKTAAGFVTFMTGAIGSAPPAQQAVAIPAGTVVQTVGGIQFQTSQAAILAQGSTSITVPIVAITAGTTGNVLTNAITIIVSGLSYALFCTNMAVTSGGQLAETPSATLARFTAKVASIGLGTPVAIANACIGVAVSGTGEAVAYATVHEGWIAQVDAGQAPVAGFDVYVDNGSGAASSSLLSQVITTLNGVLNTSTLGYRPAGVPFTVNAVVPEFSSVIVSGTVIDSSLVSALTTAAITAIQNEYASLFFADTLEQSFLSAAVADALAPYLTSFSVTLLNSSGTSVSGVAAAYNQRNILQSFTVSLTGPV